MALSRKKQTGALEAPRRTVVELPDLDAGDAESLVDHETHEGQHYDGADLSTYDLEGSDFRECLLSGLTLTSARFRGSRFVESVIRDSFAPELKAPRTTWREVVVERPRWGSAELFDAELDGVRFEGGKIDYLNLRSAKVTDVVFEGVSVGELDLGGAHGLRIAFVDCRIGMLEVTGAGFASVDLRTSTFDGVSGLSGLRGAVVDHDQLALLAPLLAAEIGLVVE